MNLPYINLLPHRQWARRAHRRRFAVDALVTALLCLVLLVWAWLILTQERQAQQRAIDGHSAELAAAQQRAAQQRQAQAQIERLAQQRRVLLTLWQNQADVVQWWQRSAQALPDGVYWTAMTLSPQALGMTGVAQSEAEALQTQRSLATPSARWRPFEVVEVSDQGGQTTAQTSPRKQFVLRAPLAAAEPIR